MKINIYKIFLTVLLLAVIFMLKFCIPLCKGRFSIIPKYEIISGISYICSAVDDIDYERYTPEYNELKFITPLVKLSDLQPYKKDNIYVFDFEGKSGHLSFLYASNVTVEAEDTSYSVIYAASLGQWNEDKQEYFAYAVDDDTRSRPSNSWGYASYFKAGLIESSLPPIPGCIVPIDGQRNGDVVVLYPEYLLPTFYEIYPKCIIPEEQILYE